jgi:peptidoglycan/LPS O-acetylase OafA/YrhL/lysophospholipase L1-like esterase
MPEPVRRGQRYMPGLDGLRALAVLVVIAYHLGFAWAPGGLLGVGVFFTLSGYLITDLLLAQVDRDGGIRLARFWLGRARRLLPALFAMLVVVTAWVTVFGPAQPSQFRDAVVAAALYVSNWQLILHDVSYFARFAPPLPLNHLWSLAVEEQFYIVWPFLLLLGVRFVRESNPIRLRPRLAALTAALAAASAVAMALLYHPTLDPSRVYYGTDTRACELLAGAALAMIWPSRRLRSGIAAGARRALDGLGLAGLVGIGLLVWRTDEFSPFLYQGGFALLAVCTALVVAALAHPASRLGPALGWAPLRWIGVRSYGIYLWHFPIIVLTSPQGPHGNDLFRDVLQIAATFVIAALSWRYVEQPVRHGALGRLWRRLRDGGWRRGALPRRAWAGAALATLVLLAAVAGMAGLGTAPAGPALASGGLSATVRAGGGEEGGAAGHPGRSSCRAVVHVGDSTSEGLTSHEYLPRRYERIEARYAHVGAGVQHYEISGARSIVETYEGEPNAEEVARRWKRDGYRGCWVLALGTNDAADVAVGSNVDMKERINRMMQTIGSRAVLWVDVKSLEDSGPYAERNMRAWDRALLESCRRYPSMRVFDWAGVVRDPWFIEDGIHFTSPGYKARALLIARALETAFPEGAPPSPGCVVHESWQPRLNRRPPRRTPTSWLGRGW